MRDGSPWPRISVVTPSYNQGQFLEETIRSVLLQGYPNLEYIVVDGGSTDGSVEILRKYEPCLRAWTSERDGGQADAINKGFARATGEILAWLNSDDVYLPGVLETAAETLHGHPGWGLVYGECQIIDERSRLTDLWRSPDFSLAELPFRCFIPQQTVFVRRQVIDRVGVLNTRLHYALDYDLWLRIAPAYPVHRIPLFLAQHRKCPGTKTVSSPDAFWPEIVAILRNFFAEPALPPKVRALEQEAHAVAFLHEALQRFRLGELKAAQRALRNAFALVPQLARLQRGRVVGMLVGYADPSSSWEAAAGYLSTVFGNLPESAMSLRELQPAAQRRVQILHALRSGQPGHLGYARRLLPRVLLTDCGWLRERNVAAELLRLAAGDRLAMGLAMARQWMTAMCIREPRSPRGRVNP